MAMGGPVTEMTPAEHAALMEAVGYWRQFDVTWDPDREGEEVIGTIENLGEESYREVRHPKLKIRGDDGEVTYVVASQKRLKAKLRALRPKVGDRIRIRYDGQDPTSAPGMHPTQRFSVALAKAKAPGPVEVPE
jgi:hypothetical protein